jgi:peptidoglycan/LPS O-acetylase OafA/YrhL
VFYVDRAMRLIPQYIFYLTLAYIWYVLSTTASVFLSRTPTATDFANNLLIVPLNYFMWNGSDQFTLIPPAWSLGTEIQFYIFAPFLLLWPKRLLLVGLLSMGVYLAALGGLLNSDWYGYRLIPGTLLFFLFGAYLQHCHHQQQPKRARAIIAITVLFVIFAIGILQHLGQLHQPYNIETLLGLALGAMLLQILATRRRTRWDDLAGDISYGVFLNHFLILWALYPQGVSGAQMPEFFALSIALAWLSQRIIERPLFSFWRKSRKVNYAPF